MAAERDHGRRRDQPTERRATPSIRGIAEVLGKVATLAWTVAAARMLYPGGLRRRLLRDGADVPAQLVRGLGLRLRRGPTRQRRRRALPRVYLGSQVWKTALAALVFAAAALLALGSRPTVASWSCAGAHAAGRVPRAVEPHRPCGGLGAPVARRGSRRPWSSSGWSPPGRSWPRWRRGSGPLGLAAGFLLGTLAGWAAHHVAVRRARRATPRCVGSRAPTSGSAASGTFLIGVSGLVLMLLFRVDMVLLARLRGDAEVAVYSVAYRLLETVLFVSYAVHQAVFPVMSATSSGAAPALGLRTCPGGGRRSSTCRSPW